MQKFQRAVLWVGLLGLGALPGVPLRAFAAAPPAPAVPGGFGFAEIKMTGDEFVVLQNNTGAAIPDLSSYWLEDFNNVNPLAAGVSNSSQQLPQVGLGDGQTLLLSAATMPTCGAAIAGKLSVSLTDSSGFLELVQMTQTATGAISEAPGDVVSWSSGTSGIIQSVPSSSKDPKAVYYRYQSGVDSYGWQLADQDTTVACQLNVVVTGSSTPQPIVAALGQATTSPPAIILSLADDSESSNSENATAPTLPAADLGLLAPQITELLPNPAGTGTDGSDEFIELYNPNAAMFDLTGFTLQVGTATLHTYTFPAGATIGGKSFKAFFANDTGLSMSNGGGQAALLDPFGTQISQSGGYGTAKDGQAWALANGSWYWTLNPTPGSMNVINQPASITKVSKSSITNVKAATAKTPSVKGTSTAKTAPAAGTTGTMQDAALTTPIHPWALALVAGLALLYGAYEYRVDLRNRFAQFRADRAARRVAGP